MSKTNSHETQYLTHIFTNGAIANVGDASGLPAAATVGSLFLRLYTSAVAVTDSVIGTEASYTGYVQETIARNGTNWTVSGNNVENTLDIDFPQNTGSSQTIRYWALWKTSGGTLDTDRLYHGQFTADLVVGTNVTPKITATSLDITED